LSHDPPLPPASGSESSDPSFESIYTAAGSDLESIPWADLTPNATMAQWADHLPSGRAITIGCGLGDDAEELARRGLTVVAFDISPTAIQHCYERFPDSSVDYAIADLFALPDSWRGTFDAVVEIRTLQSLRPDTRERAARAIAALLAPGGRLLVICYGREDDWRPVRRPWPVTRAELDAFARAGLAQLRFDDQPLASPGDRTWTVDYARADA
jgi:SAM-dependent methyltransferase